MLSATVSASARRNRAAYGGILAAFAARFGFGFARMTHEHGGARAERTNLSSTFSQPPVRLRQGSTISDTGPLNMGGRAPT